MASQAGPAARFAEVPRPDFAAYRRMQRLLRNAVSPAAPVTAEQLGRLRDLAAFFAAARGEVPPPPVGPARAVVFAAQHGVSAPVDETTVELARALAENTAPTHVFAQLADCPVQLVDVALATDIPGFPTANRVRQGVGSIAIEDAMTAQECEDCLELGRQIADAAIDGGTDVVAPIVFGPGARLAALAVFGRLTDTEPVTLQGFMDTDDRAWSKQVTLVRDAMFRARSCGSDPVALLRICGGCDLAAAASFIAEAAVRRTPVILDSLETTVAALLAEALAPGSSEWLVVGQLTPHPAHALVLRRLGRKALFAMNMPLGLGSGAMTTLQLLRAAVVIAGGNDPEPTADDPRIADGAGTQPSV